MALTIEKRMQDAGYRLLGDDKNIETLIIDILHSKNERFLKAIPFLIYKYDLNLSMIRERIDDNDRELYGTIINFIVRIFRELNIQKNIASFMRDNGTSTDFLSKKYKISISYDEYKEEFELQLRNEIKSNFLIDTQKIDEERNLQFGLSQLFTKKEKLIIKRLQEDKSISRTDYEYYSRKTKKKLRSIISLNEFAKNIYAKTPKYDEDLFDLKKRLEIWLKTQQKIPDPIESFHKNSKEISITLINKEGKTSQHRWRLDKIHDNTLLLALGKYQDEDFR